MSQIKRTIKIISTNIVNKFYRSIFSRILTLTLIQQYMSICLENYSVTVDKNLTGLSEGYISTLHLLLVCFIKVQSN